MVPTRAAVRAAHDSVAAIAPRLGGRLLHELQRFEQYPQPYFATFWLDLWDVMLEVVRHHNRD